MHMNPKNSIYLRPCQVAIAMQQPPYWQHLHVHDSNYRIYISESRSSVFPLPHPQDQHSPPQFCHVLQQLGWFLPGWISWPHPPSLSSHQTFLWEVSKFTFSSTYMYNVHEQAGHGNHFLSLDIWHKMFSKLKDQTEALLHMKLLMCLHATYLYLFYYF